MRPWIALAPLGFVRGTPSESSQSWEQPGRTFAPRHSFSPACSRLRAATLFHILAGFPSADGGLSILHDPGFAERSTRPSDVALVIAAASRDRRRHIARFIATEPGPLTLELIPTPIYKG